MSMMRWAPDGRAVDLGAKPKRSFEKLGRWSGRLTLAATGSWTAEHAYELEPLVEAVTEKRLTAGGVSIDMGRIDMRPFL